MSNRENHTRDKDVVEGLAISNDDRAVLCDGFDVAQALHSYVQLQMTERKRAIHQNW